MKWEVQPKDRKHKKESNRNFGAEEYNQTGEFNRELQQQTEASRRINELEDKLFEIIQSEEQKEKRMKRNEESLWDLGDTTKKINLCIIAVPQGGGGGGVESCLKKIMAQNFPNLGKDLHNQVQKANRSYQRFNLKQYSSEQFVIKLSKIKNGKRILKTAENFRIHLYEGSPIRLSAYFSALTLQSRREWVIYSKC